MSIHVFCSNGPCTRSVSPDEVVSHDGKNYCSRGCAHGRGCDRADCGCTDSVTDHYITPPRATAKAS